MLAEDGGPLFGISAGDMAMITEAPLSVQARRLDAQSERAVRNLDAAVHRAEKTRERVWQDEQTLNAQWGEMEHEVVRLLKIVQWFQRVSPAFLLMVLAFGAWSGAGLISLALLHYLLMGSAFICGALAFVIFAVGYKTAG